MQKATAIIPPCALRGHDILVLSPSEWQDNAVSNMQIATILSETNRVVYVETMGGRMPRLSELGRVYRRLLRIFGVGSGGGKKRGLNPRNVSILSPFAFPIHGNAFIDWLNRGLLLMQIRRRMRRLGMGRPIIWSFSPRWTPVVDRLENLCVIFHCVDALHTYDSSQSFQRQFEHTVRDADIVFTPGALLEQELKKLNCLTYQIGHGCGQDHLTFLDGDAEPEDLKLIPEPRVVYAGTLANWVDYGLLRESAARLPHVSFVLIGYVHALAPREQVETVCALPNIYCLGYKDFCQLPRYYRRAKVGIVPYEANNEHIRYSTPTKFLDYLAAGLPVVSTCFPAAEAMQEQVVCANTESAFSDAISLALADTSPKNTESRREYARDHTWERQVEKMCRHIRGYLDGRN